IKAARLALQQSSYEKQQQEIVHMQDFVRRFRAKATKARQAQSRIKALERLELIAPAHIDSPFSFEIKAQEKASTPLLTLVDANLGYESAVLENVNLSFLPGDRYGLLGVNGAGKSTLIKTLNMELPVLSGSKTGGANLNTAYFSQHQLDELDLTRSAVEHFFELGRQLGPVPGEQEARNFLGGFNFHGDKVLKPAGTFSGGEKARLALALIAWTKPNLLLLDEPTNHLDIEMRQALTVALQAFAGALILVSHDRHLMANAVDQFLLVENGCVSIFSGDLTDYRTRVLPGKGKDIPSNESGAKTMLPRTAKRPGKEARQLKTRLNTLEIRMERLQRKLGEVGQELSDPAFYQSRSDREKQGANLQLLLRNQTEFKEKLEVMEGEWLEISTKLESI
ncbi:ATP-binding cassette domain-containing protein, partial [Gammaproteobacteria bacterium]|nr:ATP-binding cassette domain-containing protein [Gammaproteobacteria bacterium]